MPTTVQVSGAVRGRPRNKDADTKIMEAALQLLKDTGFKSVTMEGIAEKAGVARTTVYRRWPNKAAIIMDAFLREVGPGFSFPETSSAFESLHAQMKLLARALRGRAGLIMRSILAEAQFNPELQTIFREQWMEKRRDAGRKVIRAGIASGEIPSSVDPDILLEALFGGLYFRLLLDLGPLTDKYVESLWSTVTGAEKRTNRLSSKP